MFLLTRWLFRGRVLLAGVVVALVLWGYAAFRIYSGHLGMTTFLAAAAGVMVLILGMRGARQAAASSGDNSTGDRS
ncbi:MAG: hypothetical protein ACXWQR_17770 [Ktedonobacterales bacterium]